MVLTVKWNCDCGPYVVGAVHSALSILVRGRKDPVARVGIDKFREVVRDKDTSRRRGERRTAIAASWSILRFLTTTVVSAVMIIVVVVAVILHIRVSLQERLRTKSLRTSFPLFLPLPSSSSLSSS